MAYLGQENHVHTDLAARNIQVAVNNVVKISNFELAGFMANGVYNPPPGNIVPQLINEVQYKKTLMLLSMTAQRNYIVFCFVLRIYFKLKLDLCDKNNIQIN